MQIVKPDINLDFIGKRKLAFILSAVLILVGLGSLLVKGGPNYGIDFAGGTLVQVRFAESTGAGEIKDALSGVELGSVVVQQFGDQADEYLIRTQSTTAELEGLAQKVEAALQEHFGAEDVDLRRAEMVGPQVGKDLRKKGLMAVIWAFVGILVYITWRFELRFALGAVIATIHDVLITLGAFSLFGKEIDLPIIAAFLAIIGYSLNDSIIVLDRIRENMGKYAKQGFATTINRSINETLSRTVLTSGTTLLVILALFVFGGGVIHNFAFAMLVGVLVGTYSSIFVASPVILLWDKGTGSGQTAAAAGRSA